MALFILGRGSEGKRLLAISKDKRISFGRRSWLTWDEKFDQRFADVLVALSSIRRCRTHRLLGTIEFLDTSPHQWRGHSLPPPSRVSL